MVSWKNKLGLVRESGTSVGKASVGCTQLTQGPPSSGLSQAPCTGPETNEGSSGHDHTCVVCWVLCLLHVWVARSFGLLLSAACWLCNYPLFAQLLTGVGQPSLRFTRVCLCVFWPATVWKPCLLSFKIVVGVLIIHHHFALVGKSKGRWEKKPASPV